MPSPAPLNSGLQPASDRHTYTPQPGGGDFFWQKKKLRLRHHAATSKQPYVRRHPAATQSPWTATTDPTQPAQCAAEAADPPLSTTTKEKKHQDNGNQDA